MRLGAVALLAVVAVSPVRAQDGVVSAYAFDMNLAEISEGNYLGRYRVDVSYRYQEPEKAEVTSWTEDSDVSGPRTMTALRLSGALLHSVNVSVRTLDEEGRLGVAVAHGSWSGDMLWANVPQPSSPVGESTTRIGGVMTALPALDFHDGPTGRAVRLNMDARQSVVARFLPGPDGTLRFGGYAKNEPDLLVVQAAVADTSRLDGKLFSYNSIIEAGSHAEADVQCRTPGEARLLRPLRSIDASSTGRAEVCYPSGAAAGYERIVVGVRNPDHHLDYGSEVQGLTEGRRPGGGVAADLLYPIAPERLSETNCFGYALLATRPELVRELPEGGYWIPGKRDYLSEGTLPLQAILKTHYDLVKRVPADKAADLATDPDVRPGDLAALFKNVDYDHAGVLVDHDGELWLQSKVGESLVYDSPLENLEKTYNSNFVEVYRVKGSRPEPRAGTKAFGRSRSILKDAESLSRSLSPAPRPDR